jgi:hypothetical protein
MVRVLSAAREELLDKAIAPKRTAITRPRIEHLPHHSQRIFLR